jgi:hypothetical protein
VHDASLPGYARREPPFHYRKTTIEIEGGEVDLRGLLEAVDHTGLAGIAKAIGEQNLDAFGNGYRQTLEGCYTCHKASDKPYLRPRIPEQPEVRIINFDPAATWP